MRTIFLVCIFCLPFINYGQELTFANGLAKELASMEPVSSEVEFVPIQFSGKTSTKKALEEMEASGLRPASPAEVVRFYEKNGAAVLSPKKIRVKDGLFKKTVIFGINNNYASTPSFRGPKWCEDIIFLAVKD